MVTLSTCSFSYSYSLQLLMRPTLKMLKCVNCHLCSSKKFTNETGKTFYVIIFYAVYLSLTLSSPLSTLDSAFRYYSADYFHT